MKKTQGTIIRTAEQEEYPHPRHDRFFLRDVVTAAINPDLSLHRGRIEVGGEIGLHTHEDRTETFYLLCGEALCTLDGQEHTFGPGCCVVAPPGVPHGLKNVGDEPVDLLAIFTPPLK
jgi:mannose-6-phosphate isomerase-like protein (cupin superfamily)